MSPGDDDVNHGVDTCARDHQLSSSPPSSSPNAADTTTPSGGRQCWCGLEEAITHVKRICSTEEDLLCWL